MTANWSLRFVQKVALSHPGISAFVINCRAIGTHRFAPLANHRKQSPATCQKPRLPVPNGSAIFAATLGNGYLLATCRRYPLPPYPKLATKHDLIIQNVHVSQTAVLLES
jgi:hypothetical protein